MNGFGIIFLIWFCQVFEKIFTTCAEILIIIIKLNSKVFQLLGLNFSPTTSRG
jgi:hypothetical protein